MIPATLGSELKKIIDRKLRILGLWENVRVVEKPGAKVIDVLKNHNQKKKKTACADDDWLVGQNSREGNCQSGLQDYLWSVWRHIYWGNI